MNEISPAAAIETTLASQRTAFDVTRLPEQLISHPCDQLIAALTRAQEEIRAPMKNKTAQIRTRDGRQYQYSYATLDAVIDAVRLPLARNGIVETQLQNGDRLEVLLIHASGQWMRASMPLRMLDESQQAMASAITSARRLALQAMLGIAAEDDDDGSAGAGNEISDAGWQPRADGDEEASQIVRMAHAARGIAGARNLIRSWIAHRPESERLRREDPLAWRRAVDAVGTALDHSLGGAIAACWRSAELAETRAHQQAVREAMDGKWADILARFRVAEPAIHGDLMRHYNDRCAIIETAAAREQPTKRDLEVARQQPEQTFRHPLIDAGGWSLINDEEEEDVWLSPDPWARRFEALYREADPDQRAALRDYNAAAIEDASHSLGAEVIFTDLFAVDANVSPAIPSGTAARERPGSMPASARKPDQAVVPPRGMNGGVDKPAYLALLKASIAARVHDARDAAAWVSLNEPFYRSAGAVMGVEVLKLLADRKRALGIPPGIPMGSSMPDA